MSVTELSRPELRTQSEASRRAALDAERPARWTAEPGVIAGVITGTLALVAAVAGVWSLLA